MKSPAKVLQKSCRHGRSIRNTVNFSEEKVPSKVKTMLFIIFHNSKIYLEKRIRGYEYALIELLL